MINALCRSTSSLLKQFINRHLLALFILSNQTKTSSLSLSLQFSRPGCKPKKLSVKSVFKLQSRDCSSGFLRQFSRLGFYFRHLSSISYLSKAFALCEHNWNDILFIRIKPKSSTSWASTCGIKLALLFVCGNVAFFSIGIGPICWVLTSEIFPLRLRAQASGIGDVGSRVSSGVISMSFLSVTAAITVAGTFFVFAVISAVSVVFVYTCVPETKGKSLEEIEIMFEDIDKLRGGEMELTGTARLVPQAPITP